MRTPRPAPEPNPRAMRSNTRQSGELPRRPSGFPKSRRRQDRIPSSFCCSTPSSSRFFVAQAFIVGCLLAYGGLPLPPEWAGALDRRPASGLPLGRPTACSSRPRAPSNLASVRLFSDAIEEPLLTAEALRDRARSPVGRGVDAVHPGHRFKVEGSLYMPAVHSPDGRRTETASAGSPSASGPKRTRSWSKTSRPSTRRIRLRGMIQWPRTEGILPRTGAPAPPPPWRTTGVDLAPFLTGQDLPLCWQQKGALRRFPASDHRVQPCGPPARASPSFPANGLEPLAAAPGGGPDVTFFLHSPTAGLDEGCRPSSQRTARSSPASELESRRHPLKARGPARQALPTRTGPGSSRAVFPRVDLAADRISALRDRARGIPLGPGSGRVPRNRGRRDDPRAERRSRRRRGRSTWDERAPALSRMERGPEQPASGKDLGNGLAPPLSSARRRGLPDQPSAWPEGFDFEEAKSRREGENGFSVELGLEFDHPPRGKPCS